MNSLIYSSGIGGFRKPSVYLVKEILNFPFTGSATTHISEITLKPNCHAIQLDSAYQSSNYEEIAVHNEDGNYYKVELKIFIARADEARTSALKKIEFEPVIIDITDNNNVRRLIGTPYYPLKIDIALTIPKVVENRSGFEITFKGLLPFRAPVVAN